MIFEFDWNHGLFEARSRGPKKRSGGRRESPELDIRRIAKIFIQWNQNLYFHYQNTYIILGGFFKNFIFPTSGRYLQASALIKEYQCEPSFLLMYTGIRKVKALDHRAEPAACNDWLT